jgi:hypothetical protein
MATWKDIKKEAKMLYGKVKKANGKKAIVVTSRFIEGASDGLDKTLGLSTRRKDFVLPKKIKASKVKLVPRKPMKDFLGSSALRI